MTYAIKLKKVVTAMVVGVSLLSGEAMFASPVSANVPVHAMYGNEKMVKFSVLNTSNAPMKLKAGDTEMTLLPGKAQAMKLAVGTKIVAVESNAHFAAGDVLAVVSSGLSDATVTLN
jgi:hypothetical protein